MSESQENIKLSPNKGNTDLLKKIKEVKNKTENDDKAVSASVIKYMVIDINGKKYALLAEEVREIIGNIPVFYVPFTPPYIRGFINRHGEPYTVIDLTLLLERENQNSSTFLILSRENDQIALLISEVIEIVKLPKTELHKITSKAPDDDFFLGSISPQNKDEIFVLNLDSVLKKLEGDISAC